MNISPNSGAVLETDPEPAGNEVGVGPAYALDLAGGVEATQRREDIVFKCDFWDRYSICFLWH